MPVILIADRDFSIRQMICEQLQSVGYSCLEAQNSKDVMAILEQGRADLAILDIESPDIDAMACLSQMRKQKIYIPVILLGVSNDEAITLAGLDGGADDYVIKPFSSRELAARVKAVLSRSRPEKRLGSGSRYSFGQLLLDIAGHSVKVAGQEVVLTPKEYDLLVFLAEHRGLVLTRQNILQKVWNYESFGEERTVDTHIGMLRGHLGPCRDYIVTVWGVGYLFDPAGPRKAGPRMKLD